MRHTALIGFLLALAASAETPTERRWQSYFEVAIRSKWAKEELSENRVITVRGHGWASRPCHTESPTRASR